MDKREDRLISVPFYSAPLFQGQGSRYTILVFIMTCILFVCFLCNVRSSEIQIKYPFRDIHGVRGFIDLYKAASKDTSGNISNLIADLNSAEKRHDPWIRKKTVIEILNLWTLLSSNDGDDAISEMDVSGEELLEFPTSRSEKWLELYFKLLYISDGYSRFLQSLSDDIKIKSFKNGDLYNLISTHFPCCGKLSSLTVYEFLFLLRYSKNGREWLGEIDSISKKESWIESDDDIKRFIAIFCDIKPPFFFNSSGFGDRILFAFSGSNIAGSDYSDFIYGSDFDDVIESGKGYDVVDGDGGSNTYVFHDGDGVTVINQPIYENSLSNKLIFPESKSVEWMFSMVDGDNLVIRNIHNEDFVRIDDWCFNYADSGYIYSVHSFIFSDGQSFSAEEIFTKIQ